MCSPGIQTCKGIWVLIGAVYTIYKYWCVHTDLVDFDGKQTLGDYVVELLRMSDVSSSILEGFV